MATSYTVYREPAEPVALQPSWPSTLPGAYDSEPTPTVSEFVIAISRSADTAKRNRNEKMTYAGSPSEDWQTFPALPQRCLLVIDNFAGLIHKFVSNVNTVLAHLPVTMAQPAYCSHGIDDNGTTDDSPSTEQTPLLFAPFGYPRARCNPRPARGDVTESRRPR